MLAPAIKEDNNHTAKQNYIKDDKTEHAFLSKNTYRPRLTQKKLKPGLDVSYDIRPEKGV